MNKFSYFAVVAVLAIAAPFVYVVAAGPQRAAEMRADLPASTPSVVNMTQAERKERHVRLESEALNAKNLARDPLDRAKAVCALYLQNGESAFEPVHMFDWPTAEVGPGVWRVDAHYMIANRVRNVTCTLMRDSEMDLEVVGKSTPKR